jgi:hypothetical protein
MSAQRTCLLNKHVLAYLAFPLGAVAVLRDSLIHFLAVPVLQRISCKQPTACITVHTGHEWALMAMGCTPHPHLGLLVGTTFRILLTPRETVWDWLIC